MKWDPMTLARLINGEQLARIAAFKAAWRDASPTDAAAVPSMQDASLGCGDSTKVEK